MIKTFLDKSVKGQSRQYRKVCRSLGIKFPLTGAFHLGGGKPFAETLLPGEALKYKKSFLFVVVGPYGIPVAKPKPAPMPVAAQVTAAPPTKVGAVYHRKATGTRANGKSYVNYRPVRNPKAGESYHVKGPDGKWVEVGYSDHLRKLEELAAA